MEFGDCEKLLSAADEFESSVHASSSSSPSSSSLLELNLCRICHDEEEQNSMEAPCSCSGTLRFAHRRCIQRWCYERGSNVCEICLQRFEPEYPTTLPSSVVITIRGTLSKHNDGSEPPAAAPLTAATEPEIDYFPPLSASSLCHPSYFRLLVLMIAIIMLVENLIEVLSRRDDDYAFSPATVFMLRAMGILFPFFLIIRLITLISNSQNHLFPEMEDDVEQQWHADE